MKQVWILDDDDFSQGHFLSVYADEESAKEGLAECKQEYLDNYRLSKDDVEQDSEYYFFIDDIGGASIEIYAVNGASE